MPTIEEINSRMAKVVDDGFYYFNQELNSFHANSTNDSRAISIFLNRVIQYSMLFWGYENMAKALGTASAEQLNHIGQLRAIIEGTQQQIQGLLNHVVQAQNQYQMPGGGQNAVQDFNTYQTAITAETIAKRGQMYKYMNRLSELTQGGIPFVQAQIIARQETGYTG